MEMIFRPDGPAGDLWTAQAGAFVCADGLRAAFNLIVENVE